MRYKSIDEFMKQFTPAQTDEWKVDGAPIWVVRAILDLMNEDEQHQELMRRLAEND